MSLVNPPPTFKVYQLVKRTGLTMNTVSVGGTSNGIYLGPGFFATQHEAELHRTAELLKSDNTSEFFVLELELPNPTFKQ